MISSFWPFKRLGMDNLMIMLDFYGAAGYARERDLDWLCNYSSPTVSAKKYSWMTN